MRQNRESSNDEETNVSDNQPLVVSHVVTDGINVEDMQFCCIRIEKNNVYIFIKVLSTGVNYLLQAVNTTGNTLIFVKYLNLAGAGSLSASTQSFFRNVFSGGLVSAGQILAGVFNEHLSDLEEKNKRAKEIVTISYALTGLLTITSMGAYTGAYFILPHTKYAPIADATSWYLVISGFATWPILALNMIGQIAFIKASYKSPLISSFMNRVPAVILALLFVQFNPFSPMLDGPKEIGLANAITPWASYVAMEIWMRRQCDFAFMPSIKEMWQLLTRELLKKEFCPMFKLWLMMSFQRFTEWGNLIALNLALEHQGTDGLEAIDASLAMVSILCMLYQGIGTAGNLMMVGNVKTLRSAEEDISGKLIAFRTLKSTAMKSLFAGFGISAALSGVLCLARQSIVDLFMDSLKTQQNHVSTHLVSAHPFSITKTLTVTNVLDDIDTANELKSTAQIVLMITALGLVADALRIISSNLLNSWYDKNEARSGLNTIIWPNLVSLISMTMLGIPAGFLLGRNKSDHDALVFMFSVRTIMIFVATVINTYQLMSLMNADKKKYLSNSVAAQPSESGWCAGLFSKIKNTFSKAQEPAAQQLNLATPS